MRTDVPFPGPDRREKRTSCSTARRRKSTSSTRPRTPIRRGELDFTYFNAVYTVENALAKVKDEKGMKRVEQFLQEDVCPDCGGTRLSDAARAPKLAGHRRWMRPAHMTLSRPGGLGGRRAGSPAGGDAPHGGEHLRLLPQHGPAAAGSGTGLSRRWTGRPPPSPPESASGCSWPGRCATAPPACCMCWTSRPSACIRPISTG